MASRVEVIEGFEVIGQQREAAQPSVALQNLRKKFAAQMKELGTLRKSQLPESPQDRWQRFVERKVKGRNFKENQTLLEYFKRMREAELE